MTIIIIGAAIAALAFAVLPWTLGRLAVATMRVVYRAMTGKPPGAK